jgi:menaquinone-9 beta-reductase
MGVQARSDYLSIIQENQLSLLIMEQPVEKYQCAIIGGGLAGLCLAVQLADKGISVVLFERNQYPFHKVCGEYISMESWDFLNRLGLNLVDLAPSVIGELGISSEKGFMLNHKLDMGGFGISRFSLDHHLSKLAKSKGVHILEKCRVSSVEMVNEQTHEIQTTLGRYQTEIVCGSYGKYTPSFIQKRAGYKSGDGNYIGVKYHIKTNLRADRIELHNFRDGYCGVSKVEDDLYCLCYLTTAQNLNDNGKDISRMQENVLYKNPFLASYFRDSEFVTREPLVISNVGFSKKDTHAAGIFLLGDAAGSITPLCGNGMSMGMRASLLLANELTAYFGQKQNKRDALFNYHRSWNRAFSNRITAGYYLQHLFGKNHTTHFALKFLAKFPSITSGLVSLTHGEAF